MKISVIEMKFKPMLCSSISEPQDGCVREGDLGKAADKWSRLEEMRPSHARYGVRKIGLYRPCADDPHLNAGPKSWGRGTCECF